MIEYVIIGLLAVLIALSVIGLIVVLKKKSGGDSSSYGRLEAKLEGLEKAIAFLKIVMITETPANMWWV